MVKKGFTLIELIAVIAILATVSMIVFPNISEVIHSSKQTLHEDQIKDIEASAQKWATDNLELLDSTHLNSVYISLSSIQSMGYLEKDSITDPLTREKMNGCIKISYNLQAQSYEYKYSEETCSSYSTKEKDKNLGFIIYEYDTKEKKINQSSDSNRYVSTGLELYHYYLDNNMIYTEGETKSGLYDFENQYIFRGNDVNNFVKFEINGTMQLFRILSIDKKDYSLKLIQVSGAVPNSFDQSSKVELQNASCNVEILNKDKIENSKIQSYDFSSDKIDGTEISRRALASITGKSVANLNVGLISIIDYVNASATLECSNNYLSSSCKENNYLYTMFSNRSVWTSNHNGSQVWYIDSDGSLKLENSTSIKYLYPVYFIKSTYITNSNSATGSETSAFIIK